MELFKICARWLACLPVAFLVVEAFHFSNLAIAQDKCDLLKNSLTVVEARGRHDLSQPKDGVEMCRRRGRGV